MGAGAKDVMLVTYCIGAFDVAYLAMVWTLATVMMLRRGRVWANERPIARRFAMAFGLLAIGDTCHVGAWVVMSVMGPEGPVLVIGDARVSLFRVGTLITGYTLSGFYMLLVDARRVRNEGRAGGAYWFMQGLLLARLAMIMTLPGNGSTSEPRPWAIGVLCNLPLMLAGIMLAVLLVREGGRSGDGAWRNIGWAMVVSYACFVPVVLLAARIPRLALLMIPKTVAYLIMGAIAWRRYFRPDDEPVPVVWSSDELAG
jgi:hypothetical protein